MKSLSHLSKSLFCFVVISFFTVLCKGQDFQEQTSIALTPTYWSSTVWGDYNNDGFLDILLTGLDGSGSIVSKIYKNNVGGAFTEQTNISLKGIYEGSAAWGDYNNDGFLDIILVGNWVSEVYKNNGDNTFTEQSNILLAEVGSGSSAAWGDYNNDGFLDIILSGSNANLERITKIYKNNGNGTFSEQTNISITGVSEAAIAWGDYNNDGFIDILISGSSNSTRISKIYKNNGNGTFTEQTNISLTGVSDGSIAWGDYNNDGFLDILLTGYDGTSRISKIYKNNGNGTFTEQTSISLIGITRSSVTWGDYNNDGYLDILLTGEGNSAYISKVYRNNGNGTFTDQTNETLTGISNSSAAWGDFNNDNKLDILINGYNGSAVSKIYKNVGTYTTNSAPNVPTNLHQIITLNSVILSWDKATDNQTTQNGLNYNLKVGNTSGGSNIICPMASIVDGTRRIPSIGNAGQKTNGYTLNNLPSGTYYWSVQAIDNAFAGGTWATEASFTITTIQASAINASNITFNSMKLNWTNGNSDKRIVFLAEGGIKTASPFNNTSYTANTVFGSGSQIGSTGWYCVYNGTSNEVTITGLKEGTTYTAMVLEFTGNSGNEIYDILTSTGNPASIKTLSALNEQSGITIPAVTDGSTAWGDYNNDGNIDFLLTGNSSSGIISKIYKNNGDGTFSEQTNISLVGVCYSSVAWGDYNNDGYLDILLSGSSTGSYSGRVSKIYKNNGNGTFTEQTGIQLAALYKSSVAWGDYNNDGYLDIILTGSISGNETTGLVKLYKNNGNGNFTEQTTSSLIWIANGSVAWGDYNNDGYLDILETGMNWDSNVNKGTNSRIYKNNGDGSFTEQTSISLILLSKSSAIWGDYNNDGFLDVAICGSTNGPVTSKIYKNNGDDTFSEQTVISLTGVYNGSIAWGDYNNDGNLDLFLTGNSGSAMIAKIYKNNGDGTFAEQNNIFLTGVTNGSVSWVDYDNDGKLDLFLSGSIGTSSVSKLYKNIGTYNPNTPPSAPSNLQQTVAVNNVKLAWTKATDTQTPQNGLNYNIRVGTTSGGSNIVSPMTLNNGFRLKPTIGNISQKTDGYTLTGLPNGTYYWSVQAIDNAFAGGAWSTERTFTINAIQASNIKSVYTTSGTLDLSWTNGNSDKRIVFIAAGKLTSSFPINNTTYTANTAFGSGTQIGTTGWYCIYSGTGSQVTVTGLTDNSIYTVAVYEFTGSTGNETYNISSNTQNPVFAQTKSQFTEQTGITLTGVDGSSSSWGDYDNDGFLDILITGSTNASGNVVSKIYKNNGNNTFTEQTSIPITGAASGNAVWGDYNNDGYVDILINGYNNSVGAITKIYKNNGNSTFSEQTGIVLTGIQNGNAIWGDYDNDGFLDVLLTGANGSNQVTKIYHNNKDNTFTEQTNISLTGIWRGNAAWGDYDNDGYLDIVITGSDFTNLVTKIYRNNGNGNFVEQTGISLPGLEYSNAAWGDYNNDGYLDLALCGDDNSFSRVSKIFKNNGNNTFTEQTSIVIDGVNQGKIVWGDYDNDGYLDILVSGYGNSGKITKIYRNNGNNTFSEQTDIQFTGISKCSATFADYNNDGRLDILIAGSNSFGSYISKIYQNNAINANTAPNIPSNLLATLSSSGINFSWDKTTDNETAQNGLSYNLYIYDNGTSSYKHAPHSFRQTDSKNGRRLVAQFGNIQYSSTGYKISGLPSGTYKWSVQAIDGGLSGGAFATEATFSFVNLNNVGVNVANGQITNTSSSMQYSSNSTDGLNGSWFTCSSINTNLNYGMGGFDVWVRQSGVPNNNRKVATIASQGNAPNYTIDYVNETTNEVVAVTAEYSTNIAMTSTTIGNGAKINVTAGQNLYFRTKSTATAVASAIQTMVVPARPAVPTYSIDYVNEQTSQNVAIADEYSTASAMSNAVTGNNAKISLIPGQNMYFRTKATASSFKSAVQTLTIPSRSAVPAYTIDYINEQTTQSIPSSIEYSTNSDMSNALNGSGTKIQVIPDQNLYFRTKATASAFKSDIQTLTVDKRPATATNPIINDTDNTFDWTYNPLFTSYSSYEYSINNGSSWNPCSAKPIIVGNIDIPTGQFQLRIKATPTLFSGAILSSTSAYTLKTGINDMQVKEISMYPNPAHNFVIIKHENLSGFDVEFIDLSGKVLLFKDIKGQFEGIDITELPAGIYMVKIKMGKDITIKKLVVQ